VVVESSVIPHALRDLELRGIDHRMLLPDMYGAATHANALLDFARTEASAVTHPALLPAPLLPPAAVSVVAGSHS
jgi:hypothetical protein